MEIGSCCMVGCGVCGVDGGVVMGVGIDWEFGFIWFGVMVVLGMGGYFVEFFRFDCCCWGVFVYWLGMGLVVWISGFYFDCGVDRGFGCWCLGWWWFLVEMFWNCVGCIYFGI